MSRLYHQVLVLQCADAVALAEALAGLPPRLVVWRISDSVVALDPEAEEEVMTALRRAGLTPQVVSS